jgi:hypothetical protein
MGSTRSRQRVPGAVAVRAGDLISLLLKKRLFSSPAAFARTLDAHKATLARAGEPVVAEKHVVAEDVPDWLANALAWGSLLVPRQNRAPPRRMLVVDRRHLREGPRPVSNR